MPKLLHLVKSLFRIEIFICPVFLLFPVLEVLNLKLLVQSSSMLLCFFCQVTVQCMMITNLMVYCTVCNIIAFFV